MNNNDTIQDIVFDRKPVITFRDAPKNNMQRIPHLISQTKRDLRQKISSKKTKKYTPRFSTNLMPVTKIQIQEDSVRKNQSRRAKLVLR